MNILKKIVAVLLTVCLLFGMVPMSVSATETDVAEPTAETAATTTEFIKAFNLDCGRIYFSVDQIKAIIDQLSANDYTHLGLAFGNSGFRFLLDDMSVGSYSSDAVKTAILEGNTYYVGNDGHNNSSAANTCLTQAEMDTIITYATSKNISIIPVLNSPGHMNTIVYAMGQLGISDAGYPVTPIYNSESTININNETVTTFTNALIQKYITYFAGKGCTMFNIGADEFANDPTDDSKLGFQPGMKDAFISYVNNVAAMITTANMTPMMFNDGYAWSDASFNKNIVICYWTFGAVSSTAIANAGHKLINTSQKWYYVLGEPFGTAARNWCSYASATNGVNNVSVTTMIDGGTVGDSLIGAQMCLWCDYTDKEYTDEEVTKVSTLISTLATNNPTYFSLTSDDTETTEPEAETRSITVAVNGTATDTISGYSYNEYTNTDSTKASVALETVEGVAETTVSTTAATELEAGVAYIIRVYNTTYALSTNTGSSAWGTNTLAFESNSLTANEDHLWTLEASGEGYKLKSADGYLNLGTGNNAAYLDSTGEVFTITYTDTGWTIMNPSGEYINNLGGAYSAGGWTGDGTRFDLYKVTQAPVDSTEVTFTGLEVGTTTVTVGYVTYTVTVIEEDLNNVTLTYHPWISTYSVHEEGYGSANCNNPGIANPQTLAATADGVYSETGAVFANFVWATGDWKWEEDAQTCYWKATVLPEGSHQEGEQSIDRSMSGTDFTYIRYWGGVWSYSADRVTWTEFKDTDEVCTYYLQKTAVTTEVDTYVKDWAFTTDNSDGQDESRYQKALSFAVVYPGGTMNPSEDDIYANSTLIYWDNLADLGFIRIGVTDYEVSKITYTLGARTDTDPEFRNWTTSDSITWNKTTVGDTTWYDETICWDESYGTEPVVNGQDLDDAIYAGSATSGTTNYNGTWGANDAVLILIYLKPVVTEDSLTVVYYDEKFGDTLYTYNIAVPADSNFNNGIGAVTTTDGNTTINTNTIPGKFETNDERIDVTGFGITNNLGVIQSFQTDLTKVPEAIGKYNSALYKYTGSVISEDGKTLYLYYNIDTTVLSPNYVVDFGLPITFNLSELLGTGTEADDVTAVSGLSARYGTLTYDSANRSFKYTPTSILQNIDVLSITLTIDGKTNTTNVGVTPATTVYYEESFLTWDSNWTGGNAAITVGNQTAEVLGTKQNNFGYDPIYDKTTGASNGTNATTSTIGAKASFTFTGDGIQVFANSTESTGYVAVQVKDSSDAIVSMAFVDTVVDESTTNATSGQTGAMYGLPIVSLIDLTNMPHDTYTVTITKIMDSDPVYIDGIRVFNTIADSSESSIYKADLEDNPDFYELRDMVLNAIGVAEDTSVDYKTMYEQVYDAVEGATALITDESVTYGNHDTIQDLLDKGPKNEVYLYTGQTLTFKVSTNRVMQIGMKAPQAATTASISVDGGENTTSPDIKSSVDMFYTLTNKAESETTYTVQIKNTGSNILSITELKICDDPNATFVPFTEEEIKNIMCGEPEETEDQPAKEEEKEGIPEKPAITFKDVKEGSFYYDPVYWAVGKNITQGMGDKLFNPEGTCTRAQVVTFLWRTAGEPTLETTENPFVDVDEDAYYYKAVLWAYENGITFGLDEEHFDPEGACTRAQVVTFLWRAAEKPKAETAKNPFEDVKKGDYYYDAVLWAYENKITNGISNTQFQVDGTCKRAQAVTFLYRMYE